MFVEYFEAVTSRLPKRYEGRTVSSPVVLGSAPPAMAMTECVLHVMVNLAIRATSAADLRPMKMDGPLYHHQANDRVL